MYHSHETTQSAVAFRKAVLRLFHPQQYANITPEQLRKTRELLDRFIENMEKDLEHPLNGPRTQEEVAR